MNVLITGASGFLGQAVVRAVVDAGHDVVAMVRPTAKVETLGWSSDRVQVLRGDLRQRGDWCDSLDGVEVIVHLAAAPSGDISEQFAGTVVATENLLHCLPRSLVRFVHISSFSVYDFTAVPAEGTIDEDTALETRPDLRDAYTTTKLIQEQLVRTACQQAEVPIVVMRPGAIFGPGKDWAYGAALRPSTLNLIFSPNATFRLTYVANCADAIALAIAADRAANRTINIVDDLLPTHLGYFKLFRSAGANAGRAVPVPWRLLALAGRSIELFNDKALGGRGRLPEFMAYRRMQARWKPFAYSNAAAKDLLGWNPAVTVPDAVRATLANSQ